MIGKIHSLETFSTIDGPGIRYVVFMQGCNNRCKFCHNPDTWDTQKGEEITTEELLQKILRGKKFFEHSKGGVTFTGGEPLLQLDFLIDICQKLKENNIHIAIDTAGNFDYHNEKLEKLLSYIDLILFDIKHIDPIEHQKLIGVSNDNILKMATYLSNTKHIPMWIRLVYIPGITDQKNSLEKYQSFLSTLHSVEKVEVLPYHEMGKYKWKELGLKYELENITIPTIDECKKIEKFLTSSK